MPLARMYFNGWGVLKGYVHAQMWGNLAASSFSGAGFNVEAGLRDNIAADMTTAQITEAQRRAETGGRRLRAGVNKAVCDGVILCYLLIGP